MKKVAGTDCDNINFIYLQDTTHWIHDMSFSNKSLNLVVYPKPTVLKYSGESSIEEHIEHSLIEPLVIHNVTVKAKKRE